MRISLTALRTLAGLVCLTAGSVSAATLVGSDLTFTSATELEPYQIPAGLDAVDLYDYSDWSNNSMFPARNEVVVLFAQDDQGDYSISVIVDKINDGSGGHLELNITGAIDGAITEMDDDNDSFAFDPVTGVGTVVWNWNSCCTDGLVLEFGAQMPENLCLEFMNAQGLNDMRFCGMNPGTSNWLELTDMDPCETICVTTSRQTSDAVEHAGDFALQGNWPNPFNPSTTIAFSAAETGPVQLSVYDLQGRLVSTLVDGMVARGEHSVIFDAAGLSSGTYLYRLESAAGIETRRMTLIK